MDRKELKGVHAGTADPIATQESPGGLVELDRVEQVLGAVEARALDQHMLAALAMEEIELVTEPDTVDHQPAHVEHVHRWQRGAATPISAQDDRRSGRAPAR